MNIQPIILGFILGFTGSYHCIGMCGPIVLAVSNFSSQKAIWSRIAYNFGRIMTYAFLGAILGFIGKKIALAGWQQGLSIGAGSIMIISAITPILFRQSSFSNFTTTPLLSRFVQPLRKAISALFAERSVGANFAVGIINGFLPCGFVYLALAGSVAQDSPTSGALFMASFGLGTAPVLLTVAFTSEFITPKVRASLRKFVPIVAVTFGLLFILRGLSLGIPYISPILPTSPALSTDQVCH